MKWTPEMVDYFKEIVPGHTEEEIRKLFADRFDITLTRGKIKNGKTRFGVRSGTHGGQFKKGHVPANKGKKWDEYLTPEQQAKIRETCFKIGDLPKTTRPVWVERVSKDGYIEIHVAQRRKEKANDQWRLKHRWLWEQHHGKPVPKGHVVVFVDGDKRNFDIDNLALVPRSAWCKINQYGLHYSDLETLQAAVDITKLHKGIFEARLHERECRKCGETFKPRYVHQRTCDVCLGRIEGSGHEKQGEPI